MPRNNYIFNLLLHSMQEIVITCYTLVYRSGFLYFSQEKRPFLKKQNPKATVGDLAKLLGVDWRKLSEADKKPFEARASEDRKRYDREMKEYQLKKSAGAEDDDEEDEEDEDGGSEDED